MAEKAESKNNGKIVAAIVGAVVVVAAIVVSIILINANKGETLNDEFFKTSNTKIVLSNDGNSDDPAVAKKVHQVYTVSGDKITGLKIYSEFESEQAAKDADAKPEVAEAMKTGMYKDHKVQGKYIIVTMAESAYEGVTPEQLRVTAEAIENALKNGSTDQQTQEVQPAAEGSATKDVAEE